MNNLTWIDEFVRDYEIRVYGKEGAMTPHAKKVLRQMKLKEHEFWLREQADHRRGYDDGEPQTSADYERN